MTTRDPYPEPEVSMGPGRGYSQAQDKHSVAGYKREEIAMEPIHSQR